jgi:prepilin-type N-terminal cleavage/methylation domain-containing protein
MKWEFCRGLTLIEVMMVVIIGSLLFIPLILMFQSSSKTSLRGMVQVDTMLEARRVLQQVKLDLQNACYRIDESSDAIGDEISIRTSGQETIFEFFLFPKHGDIDVVCQKNQNDLVDISLSKVSYSLQNNVSDSFCTLKRTEIFGKKNPLNEKYPQGMTHELSKRVNFFHIDPRFLAAPYDDTPYFHVSLQIAENYQKSAKSPAHTTYGPWLERHRSLVIADFFDVVFPDNYVSMLRHREVKRLGLSYDYPE